MESLAADEEVSAFGAALVLEGAAAVCATIVDAVVAPAPKGTLIAARGSAVEGVPLRLVAAVGGAKVAVWEGAAVEEALRGSPALTELTERADRLQAMAGATMGPLHDLDDEVRARALDRLRPRVLRAEEELWAAGAELPGVILVCAGAVEILDDGGPPVLVRGGAPLFAREAAAGLPAPSAARAAAAGALLLVGDRDLADELISVLS